MSVFKVFCFIYSCYSFSDWVRSKVGQKTLSYTTDICVLIHSSLTFKLRSDLGTNSSDIESLAIEIITRNSKNVVINAEFRQPVGDFKQYKTYLENFFNKMKNSNKAIYIVGDTNLNLTDYETNIKVKNYLNLLFQKNFISVINKPTRVSCNNATIIDLLTQSIS